MAAKLDTLIDWSNEAHKKKLRAFLETLDTKPYWITIKPYRKNRNNAANSYYWVGIVYPITKFHGYNPEIAEDRNMIHELLKSKFNSEQYEFKRKVFVFELGNGFEEKDEILSYLEEKDFKPEVIDGKIIIPLKVVREIEDRFEFGEEIEVVEHAYLPKTTTKLDTTEHFEFIERIRDYYAAEHNFYIPSPDEGSKNMSEFDEFYNNL